MVQSPINPQKQDSRISNGGGGWRRQRRGGMEGGGGVGQKQEVGIIGRSS